MRRAARGGSRREEVNHRLKFFILFGKLWRKKTRDALQCFHFLFANNTPCWWEGGSSSLGLFNVLMSNNWWRPSPSPSIDFLFLQCLFCTPPHRVEKGEEPLVMALRGLWLENLIWEPPSGPLKRRRIGLVCLEQLPAPWDSESN